MTASDGVRVAAWSGPRNISTALMRSWGNRPDTFVCDEPFYAHYLTKVPVDHPGREEVLEAHDSDWRRVADWLTGPIPEGQAVFYQKHMAHHLLPDMDRDWLGRVHNVFLIRDPREMLTSLVRVTPNVTVEDTGLPQQRELFERLADETGTAPPVIDARDVLEDPPTLLESLCRAVGVDYTDDMLSWPQGLRETDGVWAKHWYGTVEKSTGFQPYQPKSDEVPDRLSAIHDECRQHYDALFRERLRP